jgi:uncharacterized cupin superfamily protein
MTIERKPAVVLRAADVEAHTADFVHPWQPTSRCRAAFLAGPAGLTRTGVNLIRLPPGGDSFTFHAHLHEEEWIYVLSGRAVLESGDTVEEVTAGDLVALPAPQAPHQLHNRSDADVVYLTGGERPSFDVVDFPRDGKRVVRSGERATAYPLEAGEALPFPGVEPL